MIQIFSMEHGAFWFMDASLFKNADFMKAALTISRKRYLVQMKISSRSIPRNILSLLSLLCGKHQRSFRLVRFPNYFVCSRTIVSKASGKRVWTTSIHLLGKLDKVYNRASQLLCSPCPYMEQAFCLEATIAKSASTFWIAPTQKPIKLYHQLCTLLYMEQTITPCMDLKSSLLRLFADYPNIDLHAMGFPQGWENEPLWRQQQVFGYKSIQALAC